jgi:sulfur-oxidizing protein SoxY
MVENTSMIDLSRRAVLIGFASAPIAYANAKAAADDDIKLVEELTGKTPLESDRIHLNMPIMFPNGYTVPLALDVDSPMTETDHVKYIRVLAPRNPLIEVATFHFKPGRVRARVSTRIRLAEPQRVLALAEMNEGQILMAKTWVNVATNGCK